MAELIKNIKTLIIEKTSQGTLQFFVSKRKFHVYMKFKH
ncbi:hypothetical protein A35E_00333 [secondary endosymbiont of Heteropsylla cubana]|uniref:Uncharacterized protein n=1 Tax=secondary endosymbiont of Heteropsylla cubana TaxID=134287 RepID=J3TGN4_9ENTR|nr:hypothetical protein A35E_00333 [secondary endosymbiont of Heteropsylla cubana]